MTAVKSFLLAAVLLQVGIVAATAQQGPAPRPLPHRETVKASYAIRLEAFAPLFLGKAMGEFDKENLDIEYVQIGKIADALVVLSTGKIDVAFGSPSAAFYNAVAAGSEIKMVMPGMFQQPDNKQGIWIRKDYLNGRAYSPALLKGQTVATMVGLGSSVSLPMAIELEKAGLTLNDVMLKQMGTTDIVTALENGAVNVGFVSDPLWLKIDNTKVVFAFGQTPDYSTGGTFFGPSLLTKRRDVGEAFVRGMVRTVRTYLQGDYHANQKVMEALAKELEISPDLLRSSISLGFPPDQPMSEATAQRLEVTYRSTPQVLTYDKPLPVDRVLDQGFLRAATK